jgi:nicotinamidase-related amidase
MPKGQLTADNAAMLFIDHQTGLMLGVEDFTPTEFKNNVLALAKTAKTFRLPVVMTTSFEQGPNGPIMPELREMFPDAPLIPRPGEINAFHNSDFAAAVKETGRKKLLMAGVSTDVCVTFAALSGVDAGYEVYAVIDASGTWNKEVRDISMMRMSQHGVEMMNWMAVSAELQADWRKNGEALARVYAGHLPFYGNLMKNLEAAKK